MNLVIVESPAKAKTINKYLGSDYTVLASYGHIRDLPSKNGSVDPENSFKMIWEVDSFSKKYLKEITDTAKNSEKIILATDPDREGEAIAWHVKEFLNEKKLLKDKKVERVVFNEITKKAVTNGIDNPRNIEISAIDYVVFGVISLMLPYGVYGYRRDQIRSRVEEKFPDFLRDLAEYWKGGLSMTVAIQTLAKGEYGNLNDEVNKMSSQISWGVSFGEVLEMFTERVTSPIVTRAVRMVDEANRAGGRISDILLAASFDAREIKALETERRQEVGSYVTVIYASFFVYLGIILVLASTFIPAIVDSSAATGGSGSMSIGNLTIREMNEVWISTVFLYSLIIQGTGMGLAAGFMSTGRLYSAFLRASFLLFLGWFIFELAGITTSMITPQI